MDRRARATGVLLGVGCGDALGRPVEGWSAGRIERTYGTLSTFVGHGTHDEPPGTVTDDTQLTIVLARSLVENGGFDRHDFVTRLVEWYEGRPFGIGGTTSAALRRIRDGVPPSAAAETVRETKPAGETATNGSVMRCAPLAIAYANDRRTLVAASRESSTVTHADPRCAYGCAVLTLTIAAAFDGDGTPLQTSLDDLAEDAPAGLIARLRPVPDDVDPEGLIPANDAVETLRTALYHALSATDAESAIVGAVNEGGDADTVGAVAGAVAGARFGANDLPDRWLSTLEHREELQTLAHRLVALSEHE